MMVGVHNCTADGSCCLARREAELEALQGTGGMGKLYAGYGIRSACVPQHCSSTVLLL